MTLNEAENIVNYWESSCVVSSQNRVKTQEVCEAEHIVHLEYLRRVKEERPVLTQAFRTMRRLRNKELKRERIEKETRREVNRKLRMYAAESLKMILKVETEGRFSKEEKEMLKAKYRELSDFYNDKVKQFKYAGKLKL